MNSEKIIFSVKHSRSDEGFWREEITYSLEDLNDLIFQLENVFLNSIKDDILIKDTIKEEFISYRNELGLYVRGNVKNYRITNDILEYLIRLQFLHSDNKKDLFLPFYSKSIRIEKYFLTDIEFKIVVNLKIENQRDIYV